MGAKDGDEPMMIRVIRIDQGVPGPGIDEDPIEVRSLS